MTQHASSRLGLERLQWRALIAGAVGALLCLLGVYLDPGQFFRSYLVAYLFWLGIPLGCLAILMVHHLVGGAWGAVIRRVLEAATRTLPLLLVLFVPVWFGLEDLYSWADPEVVAEDCDNGVDDDLDGSVDANDDDCASAPAPTTTTPSTTQPSTTTPDPTTTDPTTTTPDDDGGDSTGRDDKGGGEKPEPHQSLSKEEQERNDPGTLRPSACRTFFVWNLLLHP